jgi:hypothetical protein
VGSDVFSGSVRRLNLAGLERVSRQKGVSVFEAVVRQSLLLDVSKASLRINAELIARQWPTINDVRAKVEESTSPGGITRKLVKITSQEDWNGL